MKKILFPILATVLIAFAIVPLTAGTVFADEEDVYTVTVTPGTGTGTAFTVQSTEVRTQSEVVNGNYDPGNCRIVSMDVQANNKRTNRYITFNNETHTCAEWARKLNMNYKAFMDRVYRNWPIERIMTQQ